MLQVRERDLYAGDVDDSLVEAHGEAVGLVFQGLDHRVELHRGGETAPALVHGAIRQSPGNQREGKGRHRRGKQKPKRDKTTPQFTTRRAGKTKKKAKSGIPTLKKPNLTPTIYESEGGRDLDLPSLGVDDLNALRGVRPQGAAFFVPTEQEGLAARLLKRSDLGHKKRTRCADRGGLGWV